MGGSPTDSAWPGPISATFDVNAYFTSDQVTQNQAQYLAALDAANPGDGGAALAGVARSFGVNAPEVLFNYLETWPTGPSQTLLLVLRRAIAAGRPLTFGWKDTPDAITVIAPDAWPQDQPIPVIVCGPHP